MEYLPTVIYGALAVLIYLSNKSNLPEDTFTLPLILGFWLLLLAFIFSTTTQNPEKNFYTFALLFSIAGRLARWILIDEKWAFMLDVIAICFFGGVLYQVNRKDSNFWSRIITVLIFTISIFYLYLLK